jgi:hypothetical protein
MGHLPFLGTDPWLGRVIALPGLKDETWATHSFVVGQIWATRQETAAAWAAMSDSEQTTTIPDSGDFEVSR